MKLLLQISYLGTDFHGFQVQREKRTVQGELCRAVSELFHTPLDVSGCSRTDSGVHAKVFFVTVDVKKSAPQIPPEAVKKGLNALLPSDIAINDAKIVSDDFHVRYSVKSKEYEYRILNRAVKDPFSADRAMHCQVPLDVDKMNEAARYFCGKHDFSSFMASGSKIVDAVRTVFSSSVTKEKGDMVVFRVSADGFLYNMVRIMVGTLLDVGTGKIAPEKITEIINARSRNCAGVTAPPEGLYLIDVKY
ncbi:MAG: tRNA pseudouridine(38-40) synthase TruA [Clostridia bacterium]|nr:tRNA pseudouridine(38-40) synthase TruA [Clostridia bacterium]